MRGTQVFVLIIVAVCGILALVYLINANAGMAISTTYGYAPSGQKGIVEMPDPFVHYPSIPEIRLLSTRIPAFMLLDSLGLYDLSKCKVDMMEKALIAQPSEMFSCYNTPAGQYVQLRPIDPWGRTRFKGNLFCYARSRGLEGQGIDVSEEVRNNLLASLVDSGEASWTKVRVVNSEGVVAIVPVCA